MSFKPTRRRRIQRGRTLLKKGCSRAAVNHQAQEIKKKRGKRQFSVWAERDEKGRLSIEKKKTKSWNIHRVNWKKKKIWFRKRAVRTGRVKKRQGHANGMGTNGEKNKLPWGPWASACGSLTRNRGTQMEVKGNRSSTCEIQQRSGTSYMPDADGWLLWWTSIKQRGREGGRKYWISKRGRRKPGGYPPKDRNLVKENEKSLELTGWEGTTHEGSQAMGV